MAIKRSTQGYKRSSPDKGAKKLRIPSNQITMNGVDFPILGMDNLGNQQIMQPGNDYVYPGSYVDETPIDVQQPSGMAKSGKWIQGAVNPKHKGYCTPMTKSTCTPRRKAFAMTMKKHHGFHEDGGMLYDDGGGLPNWLVGLGHDNLSEMNIGASGIHINPKNKGKFNATKKATGKSTEELTHSSNPVTKKRAIFAQNAAKWHHAQDGAEFPEVKPTNKNVVFKHPWENPMKVSKEMQAIPDNVLGYNMPKDIAPNNKTVPFAGKPWEKTGGVSDEWKYRNIGYSQPVTNNNTNRNNLGQYISPALMAIDMLIPDREGRIRKPVVQPGLSYNEHPYGTGSQAIAEHGMNMPCLDCGGEMDMGGTPYMEGISGTMYGRFAEDEYKKVQNMKSGGDLPYDNTLVKITKGKAGQKIAMAENGGYVNYGPGQFTDHNPPVSRRYGGTTKRMPVLYQEGGTYNMSDDEIRDLLSAGYTLKIQ